MKFRQWYYQLLRKDWVPSKAEVRFLWKALGPHQRPAVSARIYYLVIFWIAAEASTLQVVADITGVTHERARQYLLKYCRLGWREYYAERHNKHRSP